MREVKPGEKGLAWIKENGATFASKIERPQLKPGDRVDINGQGLIVAWPEKPELEPEVAGGTKAERLSAMQRRIAAVMKRGRKARRRQAEAAAGGWGPGGMLSS